jgi:WD40 repeat protein
MLVAPQDGTARVVRMTAAGPQKTLPAVGLPGAVRLIQPAVSALALSPDGRRLAICIRQLAAGDLGDQSPTFVGVNVWNVATDQLEAFVPLNGSPSDAIFTADGSLWTTEAMNNQLRRVDVAGGRVAESLDMNLPGMLLTSEVSKLYPSPDGKRVLLSGFNNRKAVYAYPGWKVEAVLEGPTDCLPVDGDWSADGRSFVAGTRRNEIQIWATGGGADSRPRPDASKSLGKGIRPLFGPGGAVWALTPDRLAFGPCDPTRGPRDRFRSDGAEWTAVSFSPDLSRVAFGDTKGVVTVREVATGAKVGTFDYEPPPGVTPWVGSLLWAPDGSWLAAGRYDGSSSLVRFPKR